MKLGRILVTLTVAFALSISAAGTTSATPLQPSLESAASTCQAAARKQVRLTEEKNPIVVEQAKQYASRAIKTGSVSVHSPDDSIRISDSTVLQVKAGSGQPYISITIPLKGNSLRLMSNLTLVLAPGNAVATYSETLLTENKAGNFQLTTYTDGKLAQDIDTGQKAVDDEALKAQIDEINSATQNYKQSSADVAAQPEGIGTVAACLAAVLGIGSGTAWIIASLCGGSCAAAATGVGAAICAACIGGVATLGAGAIAGAVACFGYM